MSNSLDPDQARRFDGPDLGPNCLQRLWVEIFCKGYQQTTLVVKELNFSLFPISGLQLVQEISINN